MLTKSNIEALMMLEDERMISMIRMMLSGVGIEMKNKMLEKRNAVKLRAFLSAVGDEDLNRLGELIEIYKHGGRSEK